jgi:hypothetical protein
VEEMKHTSVDRATTRAYRVPLVVLTLLVYLFVLGGTQPCFGETKRGWKKAWIISVAAVVGANILDARSSAGGLERNALLQDSQGRFSAKRAVYVKSATAGGMLLVQVLFHRRMPERIEKPAALVNFASAATLGAVAYYNTTTTRAVALQP